MENERTASPIANTRAFSVAQPQKMSTVWVVILCIIGVVLLSAVTVAGIDRVRSDMEPKIAQKDFAINGLGVTLDDRFGVYNGQENVVMSDEYIYTASRVDFSLLADEGASETEHSYLDSCRGLNHVAASEIRTAENGVEYFTFTDTLEGQKYHYFVFVVKGEDCFYIGQFFCENEINPDTRDAQFAVWAATAREITE